MSDEHHTNRGKWSVVGVPHRGWSCVGVEDLGAPDRTCEMCEGQDIRYVHFMQHPDYRQTLAVGCICAERMEDDYVNPEKRENRLRSRAQRRKTWPNRKWRSSPSGTTYLNTEGFNLAISTNKDRNGQFWTVRATHRATQSSRDGVRRYQSEDDAKRAGLDALLWAKDNLTTT